MFTETYKFANKKITISIAIYLEKINTFIEKMQKNASKLYFYEYYYKKMNFNANLYIKVLTFFYIYGMIFFGGGFMLISFEAKNFLSFGFEDTSFTMETGKARGKRNHVFEEGKIKLLRFSAILGANSSGKSNFVKAIKFARDIVIEGFSEEQMFKQYYNRTNSENSTKNTEFKFEFKLNKKKYEYFFAISLIEKKILFESLKCDGNEIFIRDIENKEFNLSIKSKNTEKVKKVDLFFDTVKNLDNVLFLKDMNLNKSSLYEVEDEINVFKDIYNIFKKSLKIVTTTTRVSDMNILFSEKGKVEELLVKFGFDITGFSYREDVQENIFRGLPEEIKNDLMKKINKNLSDDSEGSEAVLHGPEGIVKFKLEEGQIKILTLKCMHGQNGKHGEFLLSEESDGLRRLLDLIDIILNPKDGDIYIVDELDRSLNSLVTKEFIDYYLNETINQNAQLIITTHETKVLDLKMLRKDEVWLFDKVKGNTEISALTDFDGTIRAGVSLDSVYLEGRFGGVQRIRRGDAY